MNINTTYNYTRVQLYSLVLFRVIIGWHFLYEGCSKLMKDAWTAKGYLLDAQGVFQSVFVWMANNDLALNIINALNQGILVFVGLSLMLGFLSRIGMLAGIGMLTLFYLSHPPLIETQYLMPSEGNYFIVDKNLIELIALVVLYNFPTSRIIGLDRLTTRLFKIERDEK